MDYMSSIKKIESSRGQKVPEGLTVKEMFSFQGKVFIATEEQGIIVEENGRYYRLSPYVLPKPKGETPAPKGEGEANASPKGKTAKADA